jgi:hypothetical protein
VREAINSRERTIKDLMPTLHQARKFHHWLERQNPNAPLMASYYRAATKETWVQKLPTKAVRWVVPAAVGLGAGFVSPEVGVIAGGLTTAYSFADVFLLELLAKGLASRAVRGITTSTPRKTKGTAQGVARILEWISIAAAW